MSTLGRKRVLRSKPVAIMLALVVAIILFRVLPTSAQSGAYDPYADAFVTPAPAVSDPTNAIGAPNSTIAKVAGTNSILTLDMGHGEEGTSTLKIYFRERNVKSINVAFLDGSQNVIASERRSLFISPGNSNQNFAYNWRNFGKAYRFVRITAPEGGSMGIDAIEALGYIGSTGSQDTDGDGITDREEQQQGTNPLVYNGSTPGSGSASNPGGVSAQVNPPPEEDQDNDGIADAWETQFGLNPNEQADGGQDADADGLTNQQEYELGSNPLRADTDGDGMPDKWEAENGLDINKPDADKDQDGDFFTNLGEFRYATDPNKADDLTNVFCGVLTRIKNQIIGWENFWWWFFALGALTGGLTTYYLKRKRKKSKKSRTKL